ncbi:MAG TPA: hypothetical protein VNW54_05070 [Granulicella sp.]|nr:hypothetical protein [Granulicella sp.]
MDRRKFTETVKFFSLARHYYEDLGDDLVAEECVFAIALAQRIMHDVERKNKSGRTKRAPSPIRPDSESPSTTRNISPA